MDSKTRRQLKAQGHHLKPLAALGEGDVTDSVVEHVRRLLADHGLVKVRVNTEDRDVCSAMIAQLAERVPCDVVQTIGRVGLLYREPDPGEESD